MKTLSKIGMAIMALMLCVNLASCSDDDVETNNLLGTWEVYHIKGYEIEEGYKDEWDEDESGSGFVFNEGGEGYEYDINSDGSMNKYPLKWRVEDGKTLVVLEDGEETRCKIIECTSSKLFLSIKEVYEDGEEYYEEMKFKKK